MIPAPCVIVTGRCGARPGGWGSGCTVRADSHRGKKIKGVWRKHDALTHRHGRPLGSHSLLMAEKKSPFLPVPRTPNEVWTLTEYVPPEVSKRIDEAKHLKPELFDMDERELFKTLKANGKMPTATDSRIRIKFWMEYDRACAEGESINISNVYNGVCVREYFYGRYLRMPEKVAWLLSPPAQYQIKVEEALAYGMDQLRDILEMENLDAKGRPNIKLLELKAKITDMLDKRKHGMHVQKVENKTMALHINTSDKTVAKAAMLNSMEAIEKRIQELEGRDRFDKKMQDQMNERGAGDEESDV